MMLKMYLFFITLLFSSITLTSFATQQYNCTIKNKTNWPTAFYIGNGDVINLQNKDATTFNCDDLKGIKNNQIQALDGRALTIEKTGTNTYTVTSSEAPYPY